MDLTNHQWNCLMKFIPPEELEPGPGRPWADANTTRNVVLWIAFSCLRFAAALRTGAQWADLPWRYAAPATVHRHFQKWRRHGVFRRILEVLAEHLHREGRLDLSECFIDGTFAPAKRGALLSVQPGGAKAPKSWEWQTLMAIQSPCAWKAFRPQR